MVYSIDISLKHKGTNRHVLLPVYFSSILINVALEISLYAEGIRVKVDNETGIIVISPEEAIFMCREKVRFYGIITGVRIFVGAWVQPILPCLY